MDVPDTDLEANLYEVLPSGSSVLLTSAACAPGTASRCAGEARHPGKVEKYVFDNFPVLPRASPKGSRLRLLVHCINSIATEELQQRRRRRDETGKDARTAHVTLLHDAGHPSALEIPIVK